MRSSCAHASSHSSTPTPFATGTRPTDPCTFAIAATRAGVAHVKWFTKSCDRPGLTNACVTMRSSPFPTRCLHNPHIARLVGASPIEYLLGRVLNPGVRRIWELEDIHLKVTSPQLAQPHQSFGSTSAIVRYAVRISGSAMTAVLSSSVAVYLTTMRGN